MALPSEAPRLKDCKELNEGLGKSAGIDLQGVSVALPKHCLSAIVERDDGKWSLGWHDDAPGPFESRAFALAVSGHVSPAPARSARFRRFKIGGPRDVASSA
jgi:hypothetical protein